MKCTNCSAFSFLRHFWYGEVSAYIYLSNMEEYKSQLPESSGKWTKSSHDLEGMKSWQSEHLVVCCFALGAGTGHRSWSPNRKITIVLARGIRGGGPGWPGLPESVEGSPGLRELENRSCLLTQSRHTQSRPKAVWGLSLSTVKPWWAFSLSLFAKTETFILLSRIGQNPELSQHSTRNIQDTIADDQ